MFLFAGGKKAELALTALLAQITIARNKVAALDMHLEMRRVAHMNEWGVAKW